MQRAEFERLAMDQLDAVYRMALTLTRNPEQAEDLVQEAYLRALRGGASDRFEDRRGAGHEAEGVRAWLFTIVHHTFYSNLRRARIAPTSVGEFYDHVSGETGPDQPPPAWDLRSLNWEQVDDRIKAAIDALKPEYREALLLWGVEGLKYREIADIMEVPIGTVMSRLHRARKLVADALSDAPGLAPTTEGKPGTPRSNTTLHDPEESRQS
ncbi:MAG: sigma-70 family RNA polymerase sigma factor [Phycisphaeraceae bacterium]|nr:sigma-70 family RNA polymerase sigma factor [Phycisphaeraceae bacterium]